MMQSMIAAAAEANAGAEGPKSLGDSDSASPSRSDQKKGPGLSPGPSPSPGAAPALASPTVESRIPRPSSLPSPTPLRRTGSLRVRGEKPGFTHTHTQPHSQVAHKVTSGLGRSPGSQAVGGGGAHFSLKESPLRGGFGGGGGGDSRWNQPSRQRHHRSLQSLAVNVGAGGALPASSSRGGGDPHTPTPSPEELDPMKHNFNRFLLDHAKEFTGDQDDLDSLKSFGSNYSTYSTQSACDHAHFARNGTTFSGRRMKYVVHCSSHAEAPEYLTPTQRANRQIRRLKALVEEAKKDLESKDESIFKLTREVVELRLLRDEVDNSPSNGVSSPSNRPTCNGDDTSVNKINNQTDIELGTPASLSDSGHFDDVLSARHSPYRRQYTSSVEAENVTELHQQRIDDLAKKHLIEIQENKKCLTDMYEKKMEDLTRRYTEKGQEERKALVEMYEKKMEEMAKRHRDNSKDEKKTLTEMYEKKLEQLKNDSSNEKSAIIAKYEQTIQDAAQKNFEFQEDFKRVHLKTLHDSDEAKQQLAELQHDLFQSRERTVQLEEEVENLHKGVAAQEELQERQEQSILLKVEEEMQRLKATIMNQEQTGQESQQINQKYSQDCRDLQTKLEQSLASESQLKAEIAKLSSSVISQEVISQEVEQWKKKCQDLEDEIRTIRQESSAQEEKYSQACRDLQTSLEQSLATESKLKAEIDVLDSSLKSQELIRQELEKWKAKCQEMEDKMRSFSQHASVENQKYFQEGKDLQTKLEQSLASQSQLKADIDFLNSSLKSQEQISQELEKWKSKCGDLEDQVKSLSQQEIELRGSLEEAANLRLEVETLKAALSSQEESFKEYVQTLYEEREVIADSLEKSTVELGLKQDQILSSKETIAQLEAQIHNLQNLKDKSNVLQSEIDSVREEKDQILRKLSQSNERIVLLETDIASLKQSIDDIQINSGSCAQCCHLEDELSHWKKIATRSTNPDKNDFIEERYQGVNVEDLNTALHDEIEKLKCAVLDQEQNPVGSRELDIGIGEVQTDPVELTDTTTVSLLQTEIDSLKQAIAEQEEKHNDLNLKMYLKGQEAARFERKDQVLQMAAQAPEKVSVPELLAQLNETEKELEKVKVMYRRLAEGQSNSGSSPEATLLFLKSAFYYFLTDEANCQGHLHAIQSILGFTESEKETIDTLTYFRR